MNFVWLALAALFACALPGAATAQVPLPLPRPALSDAGSGAIPSSFSAPEPRIPMPMPRPPLQFASLVTSPRLRIAPPPAGQQVRNAVTCNARDFSGQVVPVRHRVGASKFFAHSNWQVGVPTITYGTAYFGMSVTMQRFASMHECGHLVLRTYDEFKANCHALRHGDWSADEIAQIRNFHERLGAMPANYGRSGPGFWRNTIRACPEFATR